ncbi:hypothetical protein D9757_009264 [Collybiopsis confluens]|uniref:DUF6699 domain-containing protein n=1 Tax=Collybiopsis confluens TaxID=2823264 RepID=A0A8H5HAE8_9AGAR|nr:hypothetical protein D9757_009264 [Collybiopsis confluens]
MPGKRVRFSSVSTAYPTSVPPLSYSVPSDPSSSGPRTPPSFITPLPLPRHDYAYSHRKRSQSYPAPTRLHHLLAYSHHPTINYDLSLPPSMITATYLGISTTTFAEPAVYPPVSSLMIQIPHHSWSISVHASFNGQYVTVNDIFDAVYHSLRKNVSPAEYHAIPSRKDAEKVRMAYEMRYRRLRDRHAYEAEKRQGLKRVDFLDRHTRFMGLTVSSTNPGFWTLHVS